MVALLVSLAAAAEPVVVGVSDPEGPALGQDAVMLPWSEVGLRPAAPESPALGPDLLALGPDGAAALYDPVGRTVLVVGGPRFPVGAADALAWSSSGVLLVLDDGARRLASYGADGAPLDTRALAGVVPPGGALRVEGDRVDSVDAFGNGHPIARLAEGGALGPPRGAALVPPSRAVVRSGDAILVDGRAVATFAGRGGARLVGDWLLVESMVDGAVRRAAYPLGGGAPVALPAAGRLYAPTLDVSVGPDGDLAWIDPRVEGLWLVRVSP